LWLYVAKHGQRFKHLQRILCAIRTSPLADALAAAPGPLCHSDPAGKGFRTTVVACATKPLCGVKAVLLDGQDQIGIAAPIVLSRGSCVGTLWTAPVGLRQPGEQVQPQRSG